MIFDTFNGEEQKTEDLLRVLLEKMISSLYEQAKSKLPEKGPFDVIYEREEVKEMRLGLSHLILKITSVGSGDNEKRRYLELAAVNYPSPYGAESVVGYGYKQDILAKLKEEGLVDLLEKKVKYLADEIDYDEMHPYG